MLTAYREQMVVDMNELIVAADIISSRPNYLTVDERGYYHIQASGDIKEVIFALEKQLEKLNRIKEQKDIH
jgi:hypothetical protein